MMRALQAICGEISQIPELGNGLSDELVSLYQCCINRDLSQRWSASQLMEHPFLNIQVSFHIYEHYCLHFKISLISLKIKKI